MADGAHEVRWADWLDAALSDPAELPDAGWVALLGAGGEDLEALTRAADAVRRERVGETITYAINRNLETAAAARDPGLLGSLVEEAYALGATEICLQGPLPVDLPGEGYLQIQKTVRRHGRDLHIHAYRPAEVQDAAWRLGISPREFLTRAVAAGLGSVPGTGARILDDDIRNALTGGSDLRAERWVELILTAHEVGLASTATMVYGHLETPAQQIAHLRRLAAIQDRTGGFTELILMPIQPAQVPPAIARLVRGAEARETRALHAVARLLLAGRIDHLQAAWPKLGIDTAGRLLGGGADDLGGILLDGRLAPEAGPEAGISQSETELASLADALGRPLAQRTTLYGRP